jgi:hypothetical protein
MQKLVLDKSGWREIASGLWEKSGGEFWQIEFALIGVIRG